MGVWAVVGGGTYVDLKVVRPVMRWVGLWGKREWWGVGGTTYVDLSGEVVS